MVMSLAAYSDIVRSKEAKDYENTIVMLLSKASGIQVGACFLYRAFSSASFPLRDVLDLASNLNESDSLGRTPLHAAANVEREWDEYHRRLAVLLNDIQLS